MIPTASLQKGVGDLSTTFVHNRVDNIFFIFKTSRYKKKLQINSKIKKLSTESWDMPVDNKLITHFSYILTRYVSINFN